MKINILAFGIVKEIFGASKIELELHEANAEALKKILHEKFPKLLQLKSYMVAVNSEYANSDTQITEKDEVAIIPPVSGG